MDWGLIDKVMTSRSEIEGGKSDLVGCKIQRILELPDACRLFRR